MLSYDDLGRGETLVFLHGFLENRSLWNSIAEEFSHQYRVLNIDLPGFGESPLQENNITMEWFAEQINQLLEELSIEKVVIIGHSLGGYIALAFAELYPQKLNGLGLIHSNAFPDSSERVHTRNKTITFLQKIGVQRFVNSFVPPLFFQKNQEENIQKLMKMGEKTSLHTAIEVTKAMRDRPSYIELVKNIEIPILYVIGKEDTSIPFEISEQQMYLPKKSIVSILENVGHIGMLEAEEEVMLAIKKLLKEIIA